MKKTTVAFIYTFNLFFGILFSAPSTAQDKGNAIKDKAAKGGGFQQIGQMVAAAGVGICIAGAMATCPPHSPGRAKCPYFIAGGILSAAVMAAMMMAKAKSKKSEDASSVIPQGGDQKSLADDKKADSIDDVLDDKTKDNLAKLDRMGYKIDLKKGEWTDPNQKKFTADMFSSPDAMTAAGMSGSDISSFQELMSQVGKEAQASAGEGIAAKAADDAGGGASPATGAGPGTGYADATKQGLNRNPAQVKGMAKLYNGERIGVSGDSIFDMMNRRYRLQTLQGNFIDNQIQK